MHRSHVVNVDCISALEPRGFPASRSGSAQLRLLKKFV
jgi:hypothetical protein